MINKVALITLQIQYNLTALKDILVLQKDLEHKKYTIELLKRIRALVDEALEDID